MGLSLASFGVLSGTPNIDGQFPITLKVTDALGRSASVPTTVRVSLARPPSAFTKTGSLLIPRSGHAATLLLTNEVLVTGGGNGGPDATAELYDSGTSSFRATMGHMTEARSGHTATLLSNANLPNHGKVLIVGSVGTSAELYDPVKSTFAATGSMNHARSSPTATLLNTGKALVVGGDPSPTDLRAELYNPASGTFTYTGSTTTLRTGHTATMLIGGSVLIAGGNSATGPTATAEVYNPISGTFTRTVGNMTVARSGHTATLLGLEDGSQDGRVLIIGTDGSADLYNPNTERFTRVGSTLLGRPNYNHTASLINDQGAVLVAGGYTVVPWCGTNRIQFSVPGAELFASESDGFTVTGGLNMSQDDLTMSRDGHTATVLADGITVLIVGGTQRRPDNCTESTNILSSAELFKTGQQQTTFTLSGRCIGIHAHNSLECENSEDVAQCPVGQAAIRPVNTTLVCGVRPVPASVDAALYCGGSFNTSPGICQTEVKITP